MAHFILFQSSLSYPRKRVSRLAARGAVGLDSRIRGNDKFTLNMVRYSFTLIGTDHAPRRLSGWARPWARVAIGITETFNDYRLSTS